MHLHFISAVTKTNPLQSPIRPRRIVAPVGSTGSGPERLSTRGEDTTIENDADAELAGDVLRMGAQIAELDPTTAARLEPLVRRWAGHYGELTEEALAERWRQGKVEAIRELAESSRERFRSRS